MGFAMEWAYAGGGVVVGLILGVVTMLGRKPKAAPPPAPVIELPKPKVTKRDGSPLRLLALLQAESRIVDFLMEDIAAFSDAQVGQAVRDIHRKAQTTLKQHLILEAVVAGTEGSTVSVPKGFDPSAIRVLGNVTGEPPYSGEVQHPGWRVKELKLNAPPAGADEFILQPAEVQVA
ncbi:hypothetical protein BH11PLA2_BH11PLA2_28070 [soil metagenome]